jgi:cystathionine gamma-lyase
MSPLHADTLAVRAGLPSPRQSQPFLPGPVFAAPYHLTGTDIAAAPYTYNRQGNPTWAGFEDALGELEHGKVVLFSSGMAAVAAVEFTLLAAGGVAVIPAGSYSLARTLAETYLVPRGVQLRTPPVAGPGLPEAVAGATLVWLESLSNPGLDLCDIGELISYAHACGAVVAVDNTLVTALGQRPLDLGADFTVASATKYITGHSDLMMGYVAAADPGRAEAIRRWRTLTGAVPGPFETWLAHRSLATLPLRLRRQCENAAQIADVLISRPEVANVRYPGCQHDRAHALATQYLDYFGSVMTFELESAQRAQSFLARCALVHEATSFGGVHSTAERTRRWQHDDVPDGFIRLSVGCEHPDDLIFDLSQALDRSADQTSSSRK